MPRRRHGQQTRPATCRLAGIRRRRTCDLEAGPPAPSRTNRPEGKRVYVDGCALPTPSRTGITSPLRRRSPRPRGRSPATGRWHPVSVSLPRYSFHVFVPTVHGRDPRQLLPDHPDQHRGGNEVLLHRLLNVGDRESGAARRPRWAQAGAAPRALRDARARPRRRPRPQEERPHRGRGAGQVPPARRPVGVRRPRAHGAGLRRPRTARGRPGQLRLGRWRLGRGHEVHRGPADADCRRDPARPRQGDSRLHAQLRRVAQ